MFDFERSVFLPVFLVMSQEPGCSHLMKFTASHAQCLLACRYTEVIVRILFLFVGFSQFIKQYVSLTFFTRSPLMACLLSVRLNRVALPSLRLYRDKL